MPLQIRRGTAAQKNAMTVPLADGELLWTTDEHKMYVGSNNTLPINLSPVLNYSATDARETVKSLFLDKAGRPAHNGIAFTYDAASASIVASVAAGSFGAISSSQLTITGNLMYDENTILIDPVTQTHYGQFVGSVFGDDSTLLVDGINGVLAGDHYGNLYGNIYSTITANGSTNTAVAYNHSTGTYYGKFQGSLYTDNGIRVFNSNDGMFTANITGTLLGTAMADLKSTNNTKWFDSSANNGAGSLTGSLTGNANSASSVGITHNTAFIRDPNTATVYIPYALSNVGNQALQTAPSLKFNDQTGTLIVTAISSNLTGNVTGTLTGYHVGDMKGSVFGDDSSVIINGITGELRGKLIGSVYSTSNQVMLDSSTNSIYGAALVNNTVNTSSCTIGINNSYNGTLLIYNNNSDLVELISTTDNVTGAAFAFKSCGGTVLSPVAQDLNTTIGKMSFRAWNGYSYIESASIKISSTAAASGVSSEAVPSKIVFSTTSSTHTRNYLTFDSTGTLTVANVAGNASTATGVNVYANIAARNAVTPVEGMVVLVSDTGGGVPHLQFYMNGAWYNITATAA